MVEATILPMIMAIFCGVLYCAFTLRDMTDELKLHRDLNWGRPMGRKDAE